MKNLFVLLTLCFLVMSIFTQCTSADAKVALPKPKAPGIPEDSTIKVISTNIVTLYDKNCGCGGTEKYQNVISKIKIGDDTVTTIQRLYVEGGVTVIKTK